MSSKDAPRLGETIAVVLASLVPVAIDLFRGLLDGDAPAYRRVSKIIPAEYKAKAKLQYEQARLAAMRGE